MKTKVALFVSVTYCFLQKLGKQGRFFIIYMKIINKRKAQSWVAFDRSLMRDTRIKSQHKVLYLLFCSLSETCDNVYPSYAWIAREVGYCYEGEYKEGSQQYEDAMRKFISRNLEPLIELGWIKKINNVGSVCGYEVYNHDCDSFDPGQKCTDPLDKNVQSTLDKNVQQDKRREIQEEDRQNLKKMEKKKIDYKFSSKPITQPSTSRPYHVIDNSNPSQGWKPPSQDNLKILKKTLKGFGL